ncbi:MAG: XdhC/CoxF family protein, partial [Actinobacteria bacterium]|nr:XdhC/CoxF family protein [Actinomycetota bacterium]NIS28466.1 XdhC/CoxF family protein [Actinomycetota bacterium]NIV54091.1 hypothetical protein [Actinomycetota bacterium]
SGLLEVLDWRVTVVTDHPMPAADQLAMLPLDAGSAVVIASQGHYDEPALEVALGTPAAYIGLISSSRRAETVLGYLRDRGADESDLARVKVP